MKFFLDHCVPNRVAVALAGDGHEVVHIRDFLATDSPDQEVLQKATELNAVLVSLNGDFADITTYPPSDHRGIIALQVRNHPETISPMMERLLGYLRTCFEIQICFVSSPITIC